MSCTLKICKYCTLLVDAPKWLNGVGFCFKRTSSMCNLQLYWKCPFNLCISSSSEVASTFQWILMQHTLAMHFSLAHRSDNTQGRSEPWVSSLWGTARLPPKQSGQWGSEDYRLPVLFTIYRLIIDFSILYRLILSTSIFRIFCSEIDLEPDCQPN